MAFITVANGISGSAIVEHLCNTTTSDDWDSIIVTPRSPFNPTVTDPRIKFIALDFTHDIPSLVEKLKKVCGLVSHAYFCSYLHKDDFVESYAANKSLFENFLSALDKTAPTLKSVTLQTGGKLAEIQRGKAWSWNVFRPAAIIGANSQPYGLNEALTIAMYFLICRKLGNAAPMPTNQRYWEGTEDVSYAPLIADLTIFVSTRKSCANEAFNVTNGDYSSGRCMWPRFAASVGAKADSQQHYQRAVPREGELQLD
ncbi:hypothetical protein BJ170DRAFT_696921 [Xylariales sp. AK1849]|nr:hypothetical protein BJ170DRAFT_696921 [Xylariales sp. AK1849]